MATAIDRTRWLRFLVVILVLSPLTLAADGDESSEPAPDAAGSANGSANAESEESPAPVLFEKLRVISSPVEKIPGSVSYLDETELRKHDYSDIHRALRLVPGVNIQEEEGYGLRPNIGLRGSGSERSQKITLLEDGVLIAPAPYSAPSAYYFPTFGRMEGLEVRKGSSSIRQGPFTNGGVLNMMSSRIPSDFSGNLDLAAGEDNTLRGRARVGSSSLRFGWLVETYQMQTDGFKRIDGGGNTGFDLEDYLVKFRVNTSGDARIYQALEVKLGKTLQSGEETYLGLTEEDFRRDPFRRYAASREDLIDTDHEQVQLRYLARFNRTFDLTATVYNNDFFRNWSKLQSVEGVGIGSVLDDPAGRPVELAILQGTADSAADSLKLRNNRRNYYSRGVQTVLGFHPGGSWSAHDFELGLRYHEDEEDRFQEEDGFQMLGGVMLQTSSGAPASQSNRINRADAWAVFAQDTISLGRWTLTPGVRMEIIDFSRLDYGKNDPSRAGAELDVRRHEVDELIPGVGATYQLNGPHSVFAGIHRGFAPPGPGAVEDTRPEESINYELGYRRSGKPLELELIGFYNDYDNLLGADTISSGGTGEGDLFNGGKVLVQGLEAALRYDPGAARGLRFSVPLSLSYTLTDAEFRSSFDSDYAPWGDVARGDELPYLPEHQVAVGAGLVDPGWSVFVNAAYSDEMRTEAGQGPILDRDKTDSHLLVDLTANYFLRSDLKMFVQVRNLTDEIYVAARRPSGARPGAPRTVMAGFGWDF